MPSDDKFIAVQIGSLDEHTSRTVRKNQIEKET